MNSNRSTEDNSGNISGGWYNTRRQYRSIAFGTWKVGGARDLSVKRDVFEVKGQSIRHSSHREIIHSSINQSIIQSFNHSISQSVYYD
ncbi:Anthranilate--CoA ligase [Dirofilaria immitis]